MSRIFSTADMALAYELRQSGYGWDHISSALGVKRSSMQAAVSKATIWGVQARLAREKKANG